MTNTSNSDTDTENQPVTPSEMHAPTEQPPPTHEPGPENHLALIYETFDEQLAAAVPFVRQGLEQNDRVMYVADENTEDELITAFKGAGIDVDAARDSGALSFQTPADLYQQSDEFDVDEMIDLIDETAHDAVENDEYNRFRMVAEMTWSLTDDSETLDNLVKYENKLNNYFPDLPAIGLCQYNRTRFSSELLHDIIRAHPHQVYNATVTQNFAYLPPEEFFEAETPTMGSEEFVETHLDRVRTRGKLQERDRKLSELAESSRELLHGDTEEVVDQAIATLNSGISPSLTAVFFYDEQSDSLQPESVALSTADDADTVSLPDNYVDLLWDVFVADEERVFQNFQSETELPALNTVLQSGMVFPLDRHGVLFVGSTHAGAFDERNIEFAQTVARSTQAALERAEHERMLEKRNEQLRHLNQINQTIRQIDQALVQASSREEIETIVCKHLAETESYRFVWIGDRDPLTETFIPQQWAGDGNPYLDELYALTDVDGDNTDSSTQDVIDSPSRRALKSDEVYAVPNVLTTTEFETWRRVALANGFYSALSIPLVHSSTEYGVLNVYADEPNAMTEMEQNVLEELGATIAHAIDAAETRASLHTSQFTEVGLRITDSQSRLRRLANQIEGDLEINTVLPETDDGLQLFFTVSDVPGETVLTTAEKSPSVTTVRQIAERDQGTLFEAVVDVESGIPMMMEQFDASVTHLSATEEAVKAIVALPQRNDVSTFVDQFKDVYSDTTVTSVQRVTQSVETAESFYADIEDTLTDRQLEALQLAYHSGYFEWPRESSATEVAESLGVTQPTFNGHLRAGQRKLFSMLFDE
ncbi:MEDS domain-containing protein [Natrinema sp. 1APR25-10V2]|uniref:MEDS domain-containing protein n=1 Tax=Natrinema sp. 1APR25-10V2 TaxID=2951081 RepID=UPI00287722AB|nr:MEDS domain-containing protein [Natrinema sp. 1APR25-10V2]MDS0474679.1 MEDS domain-containing protein [Natrinema sp. 1APR25-10V2]